jgi:hypothetical protein
VSSSPIAPDPAPSLRLAVQSRVVVDNDLSGDPDGLVALAHHLLSPTNRVDAVTSSSLNPVSDSPGSSAADGAGLARELLDLLGLVDPPAVHAGCDGPFGSGDTASAAADAIVAEARPVGARAGCLPRRDPEPGPPARPGVRGAGILTAHDRAPTAHSTSRRGCRRRRVPGSKPVAAVRPVSVSVIAGPGVDEPTRGDGQGTAAVSSAPSRAPWAACRHSVGLIPNRSRNHREKALGALKPS